MTVTSILFGRYWGWFDDITLLGHFRGLYAGEPIYSLPRVFILSSNALAFLFEKAPTINWYSLFLHFLLLVSLFLLNRVILKNLGDLKFKQSISFVFLTLFYIVFLSDIYLYLDFTKISLLASISSILHILAFPKEKTLLIVLFLAISALIRLEVLLSMIPLIAVILFFKKNRRSTAIILGTLSLCLIIYLININFFAEKKLKEYSREIEFLINSRELEGGVLKNEELALNKVSDAKKLAIISWFTGDIDNLLNDENIQNELKISSFYKLDLTYIKQKLTKEYHRARYSYSNDYMPGRNWLYKGVIFILFLTLFMVIGVKQQKVLPFLGLYFSFCFIISFLTIAYKMEYRLFIGAFLFTLLGYWVLLKDEKRLSFKTTLLFMLFMTPWIVRGLITNKIHYENEKQQKRIYHEELLKISKDKVMLFDIFTMGLQEPGLLHINKEPTNSIYIIYGETFSTFYPKYKRHIETHFGSDDMVELFRNLYLNRDKVIFAFSDFRVNMYEVYFKDVFGINVRFKLMSESPNALKDIHYSYAPQKINANYYVFDNSFDDAD